MRGAPEPTRWNLFGGSPLVGTGESGAPPFQTAPAPAAPRQPQRGLLIAGVAVTGVGLGWTVATWGRAFCPVADLSEPCPAVSFDKPLLVTKVGLVLLVAGLVHYRLSL